MTRDELRHALARAIWDKRPDCVNKPWPLETEEQRRTYPHNPVAACDLCFIYADAVLDALAKEGYAVVPVNDPLWEFLRGSAPLDGVWFGERHPTEKGAYWWRNRLAAMLSASKE